ncbi:MULTISPECIES: GyrI-like domain-containing protein [unclassified Agarivorans]|uniref:GyrI-like domain-containing protein n=1 Tax=unclassified Agarivorans TaxID=2636026 RepID=UPI0026E12980|nr:MULTISPECIES: GyrI-like domain-containing protein [unclassified Agarivorans]MDO6683901.1 GyrI-like domain-containing protein [Agarivorans sp. 3_MG-2023]MDO6714366.1 GyrI-like domain-containing protein [Agarivorans sp. 2_MG-2023]
MSKIDFKKELKQFYRPSAKKVALVDVPTMNFLMVDGQGEPGSERYQAAVEALFSLAYTLKFMIKKSVGIDYAVMPLEGLWWAEDMSDFVNDNKANWIWTMMIMQPEWVTTERVAEAIKQVNTKKNLAAIDLVRFAEFTEGKCAQTLHVGPFSEEGATVERVHQFIIDSGSQLRGKHHEIYLSDIRRAAPENWKTVIRQAMV